MNEFDVFIFCGGKCGGTTLANTLHNNNFKTTHLHDTKVKGMFQSTIDLNNDTLYNIIEHNSKEKKIYLIDSYRTPIERQISSFFENINIFVTNYKNISIEELIIIFNKNYIYNIENYHPINKILNYYNVPLFNTFNFDKKYNLIEKDNKIFIKILFRHIDNWEYILSDIFGRKIIMYPDNLTINKDINKIYEEFKTRYKVPKKIIEYLQNDNEFKIYNTLEEQEEYILYWLNKCLDN
jgi:hypothetical protein